MTEQPKMKFEHLERALRKRPGGAVLADDLAAHVEEVMALVGRNSRVAVVWQRNHGPKFIRAAVESMKLDVPLPQEVNGVSLELLLLRMADALQRHGSPALQRAIADNSYQILSWAREHATAVGLGHDFATPSLRDSLHG
jgi:hypothetical protein